MDTKRLTVNFDNRTRGRGSVLWDFGDGTTSTDFEPSHTYAAEGRYVIKLTVSNVSGSSTAIRGADAAPADLHALGAQPGDDAERPG
ncbi:MAG: PKD domain-containing protein [Chloroflexi bacterium]|nr:PKD domain-containing protein [Chloroflexota bacterium]